MIPPATIPLPLYPVPCLEQKKMGLPCLSMFSYSNILCWILLRHRSIQLTIFSPQHLPKRRPILMLPVLYDILVGILAIPSCLYTQDFTMNSNWFSDFDEIECFNMKVEMLVAVGVDFKLLIQWTFPIIEYILTNQRNCSSGS